MPPNMPKAPKAPGEPEEVFIQEPILPDYEAERRFAEQRMQDAYLQEQNRRAEEEAKMKMMKELEARREENAKIFKFTKGKPYVPASTPTYTPPGSPNLPGGKSVVEKVKSAFDFESNRDVIEKNLPPPNLGSSKYNISREQGMTIQELIELGKNNPNLSK